MKRTTPTTLLLVVTLAVNIAGFGQTKATRASTVDKEHERMAGQLEEIAMCHHAIKAAHHDGLALDQNPYYRYIINSPHKGGDQNVYPIPQRCKSIATDWILAYTTMTDKDKANLDKEVFSEIGMTVPDMAADVQFLTTLLNKMLIEGDKAYYWENADKDIP